ncbi:MAG: hypothetical protein GTO18_21335 [Anaerolineales bacterium]|nr:hypothetical protein [Anaerolineales bacterium]
MTKWRLLIFALIFLSLVVLIGSELVIERPWSLIPWSEQSRLGQRLQAIQAGDVDTTQRVLMSFAVLTANFIVSGLILYIAPKRIELLSDRFSEGSRRLWRYLVIGFLGTVGLVGIGVLASLSPYTFPVVVFIFLGLYLSALIGITAFNYQLGFELFERAGWSGLFPLIRLGLGTLIIYAAIRIPFFGLLVLLVIWSLGVGASLRTRWGSGKRWTLEALVEEQQ